MLQSPSPPGIRTVARAEDSATALFLTFIGLLLAVGTLMVYSSSVTARPSAEEETYLFRQLLFLLAAGLMGIAASQFPEWVWRRGAPMLFIGTILLLVAVLLPGIGREVNGAQRWLRLGSLSLQPSETAKLTLPMLLCAWRCPESGWILRSLGVIAMTAGLIACEPDLGTALFVTATGVIVLFLTGLPFRWLILGGAVGVPAAATLLVLKPYQAARLQGFVDTWIHPADAPYQVQQSLTTLGAGGTLGQGLGRGMQKLSFLPEANTDFVFAVLGEELGLWGTLGTLLLWCGVYVTGMRLVRRLPPGSFASVLSATLLIQITLQAVVNIGVVTALLPPKGISHPFLSYGGSNLVVNLISVGVIVSLTRLPSPDSESALRTLSEDGRRAA